MTTRWLLLQARTESDPMREHELECFSRQLGVDLEQIRTWDLLGGPPTLRQVREHDALLVGGSGDFCVSYDRPDWLHATFDLLAEVSEVGHPTMGCCFGYHALVQALGGEVIHDPDRLEVGTYEVRLTPEGRDDPLLGSLPEKFPAQMGHKDRPERHPEGVTNLAETDNSSFQALRVPNQPVWAVQFHAELDHEANLHRLRHYFARYAGSMTEEELQTLTSRFGPSPEASSLLRRFVELVFA